MNVIKTRTAARKHRESESTTDRSDDIVVVKCSADVMAVERDGQGTVNSLRASADTRIQLRDGTSL